MALLRARNWLLFLLISFLTILYPLLRFTGVAAGVICQHNLTHEERSVFNEKQHIILRKIQRKLH